ncbi:hypothetical protein [Paraburkholderia kururiensis]|uniref:hypothetical protein n=1 Tax=Paraburkholderia kururiensis TaxID=984307 RepID=UPI0018F7532B|nr:hypothetical protein [Paraburkholderia kururiensis]
MPQSRAANQLLSDSILQVMKPLNVYTIQRLAPRLSALAPSNLDIRTALDSLVHEGKVEVAGMFMRSASYRLSAGNVAERREELTGYAESLTRRR